jgi:hypothetical protein
MTTRQKALALLASRGLGHEIHPPASMGSRLIEILPPDGFRFDDGDEGLSGLICFDWNDVIDRVTSGEADLARETVA